MTIFLLPEEVVPERLIWVNPAQCANYVLIGGARVSGTMRDGAWCQKPTPIHHSPKIRACLSHWIDGVPWEETGIYDYMSGLVERRSPARRQIDGCVDLPGIIRRYERLDALYAAIAANGRFKTAFERNLTQDKDKEPGGVVIHVDRNGNPLFSGSGHHRLVIAISLGLPEIPAMLGVVHPEALNLKKPSNIRNIAVGYQAKRSTVTKFELIKSGINISKVNSLLDVGCNEGILTSMFSKAGVFCVGLDISPHFAERLKEKNGPAFGVLPMTVERAAKIPRFDAVLLLSVHHQWHKSLGDEKAKEVVTALANKAKRYFVIEFSAINQKYGFAKPQFVDNDEQSIVKFGKRWLRSLGVPGKVKYIGKNEELAGKEPYRFTFILYKVMQTAEKEKADRAARSEAQSETVSH